MRVRTFVTRAARPGWGIALVLAITAALLVPSVALAGDGSPNPGVLPTNANAFGTTYKDLALDWWLWLNTTPAAVNPVLDETGEFFASGQSGKVWFLAGNFGGTSVRGANGECTLPAGKALFFPVITYGGWAPTDGDTQEEVLATCKFYMDNVSVVECTVDGVALQDLKDSNRVVSPFGSFGPNDMTDVPEGSDILVADGYCVLLAPLSAGEHVISFRGVLGPEEDPWWSLEVTYYLTVVGEDDDDEDDDEDGD